MSEFTDEFDRRFRLWLDRQRYRSDAVGMFARDVASLECRIRDNRSELVEARRRRAVAEFVRSDDWWRSLDKGKIISKAGAGKAKAGGTGKVEIGATRFKRLSPGRKAKGRR